VAAIQNKPPTEKTMISLSWPNV